MEYHNLYHKYTGNSASSDIIINKPPLDILEKELEGSLEHQIYKRKINYLSNIHDPFYNYIFKTYIYETGLVPKLDKLKIYHSLEDNENYETKILNYVRDTNDYLYAERCRKHFYSIGKRKLNDFKRIKYYGPIGTSGYAKSTKEIYNIIKDQIDFSPIQFHYYNFVSEEYKDFEYVVNNDDDIKYDYIIIHSIPDIWPVISKHERSKNPNVVIYGITVWETPEIPFEWIYYIQHVDKISTPSEFSSKAFRKYFDTVDNVHHPVSCPKNVDKICSLSKITNYDYVFYNISEWNNRKGLCELISIYLQTFKHENVVLYIKSFGDVTEKQAIDYILSVRKKNDDSKCKIILDYKHVSDDYIDCLHNCADCYVSASKSEGHGIGVCQAALVGNHVIATNFGGQIEYLKHINSVDLISYNLEPATFCTTWSKRHQNCKNLPYCQYTKLFIPSQEKWATVNQQEFGQKMIESFNNRKTCNISDKNILKSNFSDSFFKSIFSTKQKIFNIPQKLPILNLIPQINIINFDSI